VEILLQEVLQSKLVLRRGFAPIVAIVIVAAALVIFGFRFFLGPTKTITQVFKGGANEGNCRSGSIAKFDTEFTDFEKINAINPIGGIGGGSPGRSYIGVVKEVEVPVYSPTDMILENIIFAKRPFDPLTSITKTDSKGEYGLYFRLNCDMTLLFDHIDRVSDRIMTVAPKEPSESSRTDNNPPVNIEIKKGELLGYTNGTPQARTFDFLVIDRSKPATHINPKRWEWEQAVYAQCPYDYFTDELKEKYYAKIGEVIEKSTGREFTPSGTCGQLSYDVPGTASGGWFKGESTDTKGDYLAIARQAISPKRVNVAVKKDGLFDSDSVIRVDSAEVFPDEIKVGDEECYQDSNQNKWAYIKLVSEKELSMVRGSGSCPSTFPESAAEMWER